ncbi:MAG: acetyl-CoA carboxylase biotin carboxyl carrier protein [Blastocatellia bacterium]
MKKTDRKTTGASKGAKAPAIQSSSTRASAASGESLSLAEIRELIELISEKQFNEFEMERGGFRLRLQKGAAKAASPAADAAAPVVEHRPQAEPVAPLPAAAPAPAAASEEKLHIVTSPIVGTLYLSPSPTADPFVKVGDTVESGKTLCIIEAMKLMNEIQSDANGAIAKIFAENGQPVEYGQPLFGLKV